MVMMASRPLYSTLMTDGSAMVPYPSVCLDASIQQTLTEAESQINDMKKGE